MADRVSVGSPGGAGGNEIEAVGRELREYGDELRSDWSDFDGRAAKRFLYELADRLDAFRRSPQGEDHEAGTWLIRVCEHGYRVEYFTSTSAWHHIDAPLRDQGICPSDVETQEVVRVSRTPSPVSGTEGEDNEALIARLRDGIEHKNQRIVALNRRIYELEHPLLASPVGSAAQDCPECVGDGLLWKPEGNVTCPTCGGSGSAVQNHEEKP